MQTKLCTKCGEQKPHALFNKHSSTKDKLRGHCKICQTNLSREWLSKNKEKNKINSERFRKANPEKTKEIQKRSRIKHREKYKAGLAIRQKRYVLKNQEKYTAFQSKRRAAKLQRTPSWLTKDHLDEIETFYTAALAFRIYTGLTYHVDHIVPLQGKKVCGLHVPWNLQVISATDNLKKSNLFED